MNQERRTGEDRRRRRLALRFPDRRTGFDRRNRDGVLAWYHDHPTLIAATLAAIVALNIADYALTLQALDLGAHEANPIMATLFDRDPLLAGVFKLGSALAVVLIIWQFRRYRRILGVSLLAVGGFSVLVAYQLTLVVNLG